MARRDRIGRAVTTVTSDGVVLGGVHLAPTPAARSDETMHGSPDGPPGGAVFVVAHGFTNATTSPTTRRMITRLARFGPVVSFDFRGHGRSGGATTVGRDETADVDAAVLFARGLGYSRVVVMGFSMGGAVAIRQAAIGPHRPDALVSVSAPSRWYIRHTAPMRRVHWLLEAPTGRVAGRALGIRLGEPWTEIPPTPLELAAGVAPIPFLIVHGTEDSYFDVAEARALHAAAGHDAAIWIEPGMGHAESGTSPDLLRRIAGWAGAPGAPGAAGAR